MAVIAGFGLGLGVGISLGVGVHIGSGMGAGISSAMGAGDTNLVHLPASQSQVFQKCWHMLGRSYCQAGQS